MTTRCPLCEKRVEVEPDGSIHCLRCEIIYTADALAARRANLKPEPVPPPPAPEPAAGRLF